MDKRLMYVVFVSALTVALLARTQFGQDLLNITPKA
jgi:hypothetical protein